MKMDIRSVIIPISAST